LIGGRVGFVVVGVIPRLLGGAEGFLVIVGDVGPRPSVGLGLVGDKGVGDDGQFILDLSSIKELGGFVLSGNSKPLISSML
jgi:hypothetical protein